MRIGKRRGGAWGGAGALLVMLALAFAPGAHAAPGWSFDPPSWDFGTVVPESGSSATKSFTLTNTGEADLTPVFFSVEGNEGAGFSLAGNDCGKLIPGASCEVGVEFEPETAGVKDGQLQVSSQGGVAPPASAELSGHGAGPEISVTPRVHAFGALPLGAVSAPQTLAVANTGSLDLTLSWLSFVIYINGDTDQFAITGGTCSAGAVVPPDESCTVETVFAPTRPGSQAADLLIASNAGHPYVATVEGLGTALPGPQFPILSRPISPRASIVHRPKKQATSRSAAFWLRGSPIAARFACKLDRQQWFKICESPVRYRRLHPGRHRFAVRALDGNGRWGRPTVFRWRIVRPERGR